MFCSINVIHSPNTGFKICMLGELDDLISRRTSLHVIRSAAIAKGFQPLAADGLRRVLDGSTSIEEIGRVVDLTDRM